MSTGDVETEVTSAGTWRTSQALEAELTAARQTRLGDLGVERFLPLRHRRTVGGWCFVDHYGPTSVDGGPGMQVPPHPHLGLQTVTWLFQGEVLHRDSLGSEQVVRPGQLNLMTAGRGIAHSEQSVTDRDPRLHGLQLWVALPEETRWAPAAFAHHGVLPRAEVGPFEATVLVGALGGEASPARAAAGLVGVDLAVRARGAGELPLAEGHEHVLLSSGGPMVVEATTVAPGTLCYLGPGRASVAASGEPGSHLVLLGGPPFGEAVVMWWNFVGRTPSDIAEAVADWRHGRRFGDVPGYAGDPVPAPALDPARLVARS